METNTINERLSMVAPCGIDCGICELHICKDDEQLYNHLIQMGISKDKLPCEGCRSIEGHCPTIRNICDTWLCVNENELEFCSACNDFPCNKLQPAADRANILPHNLKIFNLCKINQIGLKAFTEKSMEIKIRYYKGKIQVGSGPQL